MDNSDNSLNHFDHKTVDAKWQKTWRETNRYHVESARPDKKMYVLDMFPYPSGEGLHVGHPLGYIGTDIVARYFRAKGYDVLHPMGFDSFGLPAEGYAIKTGVHPAETTRKAVERYRQQLEIIGLSYDWQRMISTSEPEYYRWTQWIFLKLYEMGLAYRAKAPVNWCPKDQTVLANEQVKDGKCERCDSPVVQKELEQWFFKITDYAEELLAEIDQLDWPESIKSMQRNWIGKSEGALIGFRVAGDSGQEIEVFTTRPDTLYGVTYLVLAPEHALISQLASHITNVDEVREYVEQTKRKTELERQASDKDKTGVELKGVTAIHPLTNEELPIWVADYVLGSYGTGAIMAVPAHDERDFAFARQFDLPIKQVVMPLVIDPVNPPRPDKEDTTRVMVHAMVKHPTDDTFIALHWKQQPWKTFVTGGVEEGEDPIEAARREVIEETGYQNLRYIGQLPYQIQVEFYAAHKDINRRVQAHFIVFQLEDLAQESVNSDELLKHEVVWTPLNQVGSLGPVSELNHFIDWLTHGDRPYTGTGLLMNSGIYDGMPVSDAGKKMTAAAGGAMKTTYRLRDWLLSRQRYWGAPIPVIYCDQCPKNSKAKTTMIDGMEYAVHPVPGGQLPVVLPEDVDFKPTGQSPLISSKSFNTDVACPVCGEPARREVDTMDTFVDSSWYFLRYTDPENTDAAFAPAKVKDWLPVDWYVGGAEHAVLHLLYARFFTKALADAGLLSFREPFLRLRNQGMIGGEDGRKMSKRWGNVINPDDVVRDYGADALRAFEMFMGPFADAKPWSTQGIVGVRRWLDRIWRLRTKLTANGEVGGETERVLHEAVQKVTTDITEFQFNTAISQLMILTNQLEKEAALPQAIWKTYLQLLAPFVPHLASELWEQASLTEPLDTAAWPIADSAKMIKKNVIIGVQVNGKLRGQIETSIDAAEADMVAAAKALPTVAKYLTENNLIKTVVIPGRIVNFVIQS